MPLPKRTTGAVYRAKMRKPGLEPGFLMHQMKFNLYMQGEAPEACMQ
jgi:hypothetical protein